MCKAKIQRIEGCNHMTCYVCHYEWCWICLGEGSPEHWNPLNPLSCSVGKFGDDYGFIKYFFPPAKLLGIVCLQNYVLGLGIALAAGFYPVIACFLYCLDNGKEKLFWLIIQLFSIEVGFILFAVGLYCSIILIPCAVIAFGFTGLFIFGKGLK